MNFKNSREARISGLVFSAGLGLLLGAATALGPALGACWGRGLPDKQQPQEKPAPPA
ncbi:hypothetical protein GCM10010840_05320 [Deinococcus aerolatus]|uniref:Uncharacterized protein n=1 Tax=Deinococcus aerolatus TaxID=522487 RepID=A0ABQ2G196_9DEIO|nr:hypothetical protein [Deinococcus aerolatus]GGL70241.1 hypothetical protein GCM10010840_05320 [Deinococcus aerolatus]